MNINYSGYGSNPAPVRLGGITGTQISANQNITFANSAPQDTQVIIDITKPNTVKSQYLIEIYNPSAVTDLTVKLFATELTVDGANTRYALITSLSALKSQAITGTTIDMYAYIVSGIFNGTGLRVVISNNTVLGVADGFTGTLRLEELM